MKEKLLLLIQACINDTAMYEHRYTEDKQYIGINERIFKPRTSYVKKIELKGREVWCGGNNAHSVETKHLYTQMDGNELTIGFGKEPQLTIKLVLKGKAESQPSKVIKVSGYHKKWWGKLWSEYDITVVTEEYQYELRCGNFVYIIEESVVNGFIEQIKEKRIQLSYQADLKEINNRLTKYNTILN